MSKIPMSRFKLQTSTRLNNATNPVLGRRRSKSVADLRTLITKPLSELRKPSTLKRDENIKPPVRVGIKRTATATTTSEATEKKKVKVPVWDYKTRFQQLNEEHKTVQTNYMAAIQKLQALESCEKKAVELEMNLDSTTMKLNNALENNQRLSTELVSVKEENNTLHKENSTLKQTLNELQIIYNEKNLLLKKQSTDLESITNRHQELTAKCEHLESSVAQMTEIIEKHEIERRRMHNTIQDLKGNIRVFCRVRPPINQHEQYSLLCSLNFPDDNSLEIKKSRESVNAITGKSSDVKQEFSFDQVFPPEATQEQVFLELAQLIQSALDGYNVCVFAYGQTGSGKTFTMQGTNEKLGMIPKTIDLIFEAIDKQQLTSWHYTVEASFLEIYNETIKDLLQPRSNNNYDIKYNEGKGITITNLTTKVVKSATDLKNLMEAAHRNRAVAATNFNEHSSRSHAVTKIYLKGCNLKSNINLLGSITLVDLAGSESAKTSSKERLVETKNINKSLSALGTVMKALHNKESHVPYRNSKLTFLLQSSLGGNSKTLMFVNISPLEDCYAETINSLRFAAEVKKVRNTYKKNYN